MIRDVGQNKGEGNYECVILEVIDLNNAYLIVVYLLSFDHGLPDEYGLGRFGLDYIIKSI